MRRLRLARTKSDTPSALEVGGAPAIASAQRISAYLQSHGAQALNGLLAQPEVSADGSDIDWYTALPGTPTALASLGPNDRMVLEERLQLRLGQLRELAQKVETPPDVRELLLAAASYPGPGHVYAVGREPVLVMWGHRAASSSVPVGSSAPAPAAPSDAPGSMPPSPDVPPSPEIPQAAAPRAMPAASHRWLLPSLLLTALLVALALGYAWWRGELWPNAQPVAQAPALDPDLVKQLLQERDRNDSLRNQLDVLQQAFADKLKQCPVPEAAQPEAAPPQPEPQETQAAPPPPAPQPETPKPAPQKAETPKPVVPKPAPQVEKPAEELPQQQVARLPTADEPATPAQCEKIVPPRKKWEAPEVVFVVDASGSMQDPAGNETRLDAAKESVSYIADHLPGDIDTALVKFTDCNAVDNDYFLDRPDLKRKVNQLQPTGGTPLARSIERAARILSPTKQTVMVVVTDGDDTCHQKDPCEVAREAKATHPNLTINLVDVSGQGLGSCIAQNGGGRVLQANTAVEIKQAVKQATNQVMLPSSCVKGK